MDTLDRFILKYGILVKLRVNVDFANLSALAELADDIYARQWYATRTFLGYVAPLRDTGRDRRLLRQRAELLAALRDMMERRPKLEIFDFLGWDGYQPVRAFAAAGRMPYPRAHVCDANLNQFVFGPSGDVHVCLEDAANPCSRVGRFDPELALDEAAFRRWYDRGPFDMNHCRGCNLLPVCGGGCHLWQGDPELLEPYCESVRECFRASLVRAFAQGDLP
jgi:radical SAM protein with 4Fe4S-binding SPASM domain